MVLPAIVDNPTCGPLRPGASHKRVVKFIKLDPKFPGVIAEFNSLQNPKPFKKQVFIIEATHVGSAVEL